MAERYGAIAIYHFVSRSSRRTIKGAEKRSASHIDMLPQLQPFLEEGQKVKAVLSSDGLLREVL